MSVIFLDPSHLAYEINEYRMSRHQRYIVFSEFLMFLSKEHCKDIIADRIPFSLENIEIRRNKLSSCVRNSEEILAKVHEDKNILEVLVKEEKIKNIIEGVFNLAGITMYQIGLNVFVHIIFAETF